MPEIILYSIVFLATYWGVRRFRRWSLKKNLLDVPNERSSHTTPTPRGGGLIIVSVSLAAYAAFGIIAGRGISASYLVGALAIALVSWLDDLLTISFVWRFAVHSLAAILVISTAGNFQTINIGFGGDLDLSIWGTILTFVWIVWLTNAFNFMDGIDGLAGTLALVAGIGWLVIGKAAGFEEAALLGGILAFSSFAFLLENWSPARIFMGDVGSAFLGFSFAVLPLLAKNERAAETAAAHVLPLAALLVWLVLFDTISTFLLRLLRGEKVWQAHREHIYQKLVIDGCTHGFVSVLYGAASTLTIIVSISAFATADAAPNGLIFFLVFQTLFILGILYFSTRRAKADTGN